MQATFFYWQQLRAGIVATAQPNFNGEKLSSMLLPLPPLTEQKRIVTKIEMLMPLVEEYGKMEETRLQLDADLPATLEKSILQEAIQAVRLERAKELLRSPDQQIKAIAYFCGFKHPAALCKFFLKKTGMTMSAWRASQKHELILQR